MCLCAIERPCSGERVAAPTSLEQTCLAQSLPRTKHSATASRASPHSEPGTGRYGEIFRRRRIGGRRRRTMDIGVGDEVVNDWGEGASDRQSIASEAADWGANARWNDYDARIGPSASLLSTPDWGPPLPRDTTDMVASWWRHCNSDWERNREGEATKGSHFPPPRISLPKSNKTAELIPGPTFLVPTSSRPQFNKLDSGPEHEITL